MLIIRYGIGGVMVLGGLIMLIVSPSGLEVEGFAMAVGGGLSVLLINFLFRLGVESDRERQEEERARDYFDEHGVWPDEDDQPKRRTWVLPAGVKTYEQEQEEKRRHAQEEKRRRPGT